MAVWTIRATIGATQQSMIANGGSPAFPEKIMLKQKART
jgi:hypothetical protein